MPLTWKMRSSLPPDIKAGEIIFVEKAFAVAFGLEDVKAQTTYVIMNIGTDRIQMRSQASLLRNIVDKTLYNPGIASQYINLFDGGYSGSKDSKVVDGKVVLDLFQLQQISEFNAFSTSSSTSSGTNATSGSGIWIHGAHANHSCLANDLQIFIGDMMIVTAVVGIKKGEEICLASVQPESPLRDILAKNWKFTCDCDLCVADSQVSAIIRARRKQLMKEARAFCTSNRLDRQTMSSPLSPAKIKQAQKLRTALSSTYDPKIYKDVATPGCSYIDLWICQAFTTTLALAKVLQATSTMLRSLGYEVVSNKILRLKGTIQSEGIVHGACYAESASRAMGMIDEEKVYGSLAREMYCILYGSLLGFEEKYGI
ncbi:hypothetical protein HKX48_002409 [Thoreauomyces humboldtii]|nr:hypothetical protein HKX48_002409 [Thoreauomyces humboldtii]